ncbi:sulfate adenylyltransferase subunit CysN [Celerinatantimonas diazotrophica]|uniref:Sulfate adenylyltransferase subunit 1 n=1 Tax=Celerinatantimonas diazotrophica TaxID=412034 RepID=A0A4V2PPS4_9GAMM|nr:sulfate adenylyltransferase subunit CysN [Celerinatantimonas diazotrophica]TCK52101.1 sulfate adenylyltransferase subunit 1 [Celerinatantimonas diazotrophica]CAG9296194.1 Sulfate adenylyltransferase subunit 1 [Celerinatantimonas diazotrophica]
MTTQSTLVADDIKSYLRQHEQKQLLRFLTCGSVDDGKSTLIGRLLHDSKMIFEDQLAAIKQDSKRFNTTDNEFDLALLVDGLQSEREQGITIDVAYRYFSTDKRKFIIADTPGHEQYTRNMATGASNCDLAVVMIDARYGVQVQTKRHSFIVSELGIKQVIVAINKMDLVEYSHQCYEQIAREYRQFADKLKIDTIHFVPISALCGDNVVNKSDNTDWYQGQTLMQLLESAPIDHDYKPSLFRMPVQYVNRPNLDFRGFAGTITSGCIAVGDEVTVYPSGQKANVNRIVTFDGDLERAYAPMAVTLTLDKEIDVSRGDLLARGELEPNVGKNVNAHLVWMSEDALVPGKTYDFKLATKITSGQISQIEARIDVNTLERHSAERLLLNELGVANIEFAQQLAFDRYDDTRETGSFIIIDRLSNVTVGAGMIQKQGQDNHPSNSYSEFELALNALIRKHFPHWQAKDLSVLG